MADYSWTTQSHLQMALVPGHLGAQTAVAGVVLTELRNFSLVQVMARRGRWAETVTAAGKYYQSSAPDRPGAVFAEASILIWSGPDQFFALTAASDMAGPVAPLKKAFAGIASLSDQSDGRCLVRISGPRARDALAKLSSLDLDEAVFPIGAAAATSIEHTTVNIWRGADSADGSPVYDLLVLASFADCLWRTIVDAAAEYGVEASPAELA